MPRLITDPTPTPPAKTTPPLTDGFTFAKLVESCRRHRRTRNLLVDATGTYRLANAGALGDIAGADAAHGALARALWFALRSQGVRASEATLQAIFEELARQDARERYATITSRLLDQPIDPRGADEVAAWCTAITGHLDSVDTTVVCHWLWQVKRRLAGLPTHDELMLVIYGHVQGTGKSTALRRLVEPLGELVIDVSARTFSDEREAQVMATHAIGILDEMARVSTTEAADIKRVITQPAVSYRRMRENGRITARRLMTFAGTANEPVSLLVNDTTGARRFHQLDVNPTGAVDWSAINAINVDLLWRAVNEHDAPQIHAVLPQLRQRQLALVARDAVTGWLEDERWQRLCWSPPGTDPEDIPAYDATSGELCRHTRLRFLYWCQANGSRPLEMARLGQRLTALGFLRRRVRIDEHLEWVYQVPASLLPADHPESPLTDSHQEHQEH
jgi:hypothetical protein